MHMIAVTQRHDEPGSLNERVLFECFTTARQYARKQQDRGKVVSMAYVALGSQTYSTVSEVTTDSQHVCQHCLVNGATCNLATYYAAERERTKILYGMW